MAESEGEAGLANPSPGFQHNKIQVSNVKKPLFFYVNLAQRLLEQFEVVELSALGLAISTAVTVVEILRHNQIAEITRIHTSSVQAPGKHEENSFGEAGEGNEEDGRKMKGRAATAGAFKAKMEISIKRSPSFFEQNDHKAFAQD